MDKGKRKAVCEWAVVLAGIAIGVGMFSIPTIIFYVYRDNNIGGWRESIAQINSQLLDCYNETEVVSTNFVGFLTNASIVLMVLHDNVFP